MSAWALVRQRCSGGIWCMADRKQTSDENVGKRKSPFLLVVDILILKQAINRVRETAIMRLKKHVAAS
jgi:hypothetical protein